jgi:alpha-glucosidase
MSAGILLKLDHFVDIGIGGVWLSPVFKSPMKDFGYDISDFRDIDPIFGTMEDFEELARGCKERGNINIQNKISFFIICANQV